MFYKCSVTQTSSINDAKIFNRRATPRSQAIRGSNQVRNTNGGYSLFVPDR
jgi:hypothetical protein